MNYATKTGTNGLATTGLNSPCYPQPSTGLDMTKVKTWLDQKNTVVPVQNKYLIGGAAALGALYFLWPKLRRAMY